MVLFQITIDTIFLCFCEDCERNDGVTKPYFMSKNLMVGGREPLSINHVLNKMMCLVCLEVNKFRGFLKEIQRCVYKNNIYMHKN